MKKLLVFLSAIFFAFSAIACETNEIDVLGDGTQCEISKFEIITKNLNADTTFRFLMSAAGVFYVDWGDGSVQTIERTDNTTETEYNHTYSVAGGKKIRFAGLATDYSTNERTSAISFLGYGFAHLITGVQGDMSKMFPYITTNPQDGAQPRFEGTFYTSSLSSIPSTLFGQYTTGATWMFYGTFNQCNGLTTVPNGLFSHITTGAFMMFGSTFFNCANITSIPGDLFSGVITVANYMFNGTFRQNKKLTSIPADLFANITASADGLFASTFENCSNLSGYIPPSLFAGLNNSGKNARSFMQSIFDGTNITTTCSPGTTQFITGYEGYWGGKVSCVDENLTCDAGEYLAQHDYQCSSCSANSYCLGGTYPYSETDTQGIQSCASGIFAPTGSAVCYPHILHVGEDIMYMKSAKQTTPSLNFQIGNERFYINMTTTRTRMNKDSVHYFHVDWGDNHYYVCDDTTCPRGE